MTQRKGIFDVFFAGANVVAAHELLADATPGDMAGVLIGDKGLDFLPTGLREYIAEQADFCGTLEIPR